MPTVVQAAKTPTARIMAKRRILLHRRQLDVDRNAGSHVMSWLFLPEADAPISTSAFGM
jgi:hypothetical protein